MERPIIKKQSRGYVKRDGMHPGGEWFSITTLHKKYIPVKSLIFDEAAAAWIHEHYGYDVLVDAYITSGYDKSTNYAGCEMDEFLEPEDFFKVTEDCPLLDAESRQALWERLDNIASDTDGYETYDAD